MPQGYARGMNTERWAIVLIAVGLGMVAASIVANLLTGWHPADLGLMGFVVAMCGAVMRKHAGSVRGSMPPPPQND
jgi:hypothetical protein